MNGVLENRKFDKLKEIVWDFRCLDRKLILYMILCFDKLDDQVYCILIKLLIDVVDDNLMKDNDFFVSVVEYIKYSRILCILEILYRLNN